METLSSNGNAESNQHQTAGDVLAVCTNCNRLSHNLSSCDKCGGELTDDTTAPEPKRARLSESVSVPSTSSSVTNSVTTTNEVRPQALFLNVNNQMLPVISLSVTTGMSPVVVASPVTGAANISNVVSTASTTRTSRQQTTAPVSLVYNGTASAAVQPIRPAVLSSAATSKPTPHVTLPSYNLQPPPPPFSSNIARLPVVVSSAAAIPAVVTPNTVTPSTQNCQVSASQIRIGSRKFKPISPVTLKDEGVLFMLKDFTYAPVLLNTRAIIRCRANLSTCGYPVLFLYLENSCMRQIRNIFGISAAEFSCTSPVELRRCISIFPLFGPDNRSQAASMSYSIKRTFDAMVRRYPRSTPILEEISHEVVIDTLIDSTECSVSTQGSEGQAESPAVAVSTSQPSTTSSVNNRTANHTSAAGTTTADRSASQHLLNGVTNYTHSQVGSTITTSSVSSASNHSKQLQTANSSSSSPQITNSSANSSANSSVSSPQVLVIPQDASRWQALQKNLVVGGVYNVMVHTGQRKYCLWNGTQLVPCMVQNTEVQLSCSCVRIGSMITQCVGQVRIRAEPSSGIFFTIKGDTCGQQEISITPDDILSCEVCFNKTSVLFITVSWAATEKLRQKLGMQTGQKPQFDPTGANMSSKYMLLFLNNVNTDQEDAIRQLKFNKAQATPAVQIIDLVIGIRRLSQIKRDIRSDKEAYDYLNREKLQGPAGFERLAGELCHSVGDVSGTLADNDDDDDDDVIMTQEEVGIKCPYTQQVMKDPVRNKVCGHNYEKLAILEFIVRRKGNAKCPYAGCSQTVPLKTEDLVENVQLKEYIRTLPASST